MRCIFIIAFLVFNLNIFGQSGIYVKKSESKTNETKLEWTLTLKPDGTFLYQFHRKLKGGNPEENFYGKGVWKSKKNLVFFYSENKDIDETHTMNFNNSKARINSKSKRNKSNRIIKTSIRFYESKIPEITGLELFIKS